MGSQPDFSNPGRFDLFRMPKFTLFCLRTLHAWCFLVPSISRWADGITITMEPPKKRDNLALPWTGDMITSLLVNRWRMTGKYNENFQWERMECAAAYYVLPMFCCISFVIVAIVLVERDSSSEEEEDGDLRYPYIMGKTTSSSKTTHLHVRLYENQ